MKAIVALVLALVAGAALAVEPDEVLDNTALEERARAIDVQLRCVVCQSQSIAESNAPLAKDLRLLVRERLVAGDSDDEAIAFIVARYGDYVLLKPRLTPSTYFLWAFPAVIVLVGGVGAVFYLLRGLQAPAPQALSDEEEEELRRILEEREE